MGSRKSAQNCSIARRIRLQIGLSLFISLFSRVSGNSLYPFIVHVINNFKLSEPTVIIGDDVPELCMTMEWVLCLKNDAAEVAQHLEILHLTRRQDAVIFTEAEGMAQLVKELSPSLFRSPCPVIMSSDLTHLIELRLDSNTLFYEKVNEYEYTLLDKFSVKDGPPIIQKLGSWNKDAGLELHASRYRWNRRTDLNGAVIVNTLTFYNNYANSLYDSQGKVIGSEGLTPARLYEVAERLNLTIETVLVFDDQFGTRLENGTWTGCVGMLVRNHADACTAGLAWTAIRNTAIDFSDLMTIPNGRYTLIGQVSRERVLDMWVYFRVFGLAQWGVFIGFLLTALLGFLLASFLTDHTESSFMERATSGISMVLLYTIQLGNQPEGDSAARRILQLTLSILAFMIFAVYTTDITSQMTSISNLGNLVATFDDVLQNKDIRVIVVTGTSWASHIRRSAPGTAKYEVYTNMIENNDRAWFPTIEAAKDGVLSNPNIYLYGHSTAAKTRPGLMALRMFDSTPVSGGIGLKKNSEFREIVNYQMLKLVEGGILKHIDKKWPDTSGNEEFGMAEPRALGFNNLLFPFTLLAAGIVTALASAWLEYMIQFVIRKFKVGHQVRNKWTTTGD